jgi:hypothetical protein
MTARITLCLSFLLLHAMIVHAQFDSVPRWSLALSPQVGFVIAHHESMQHLIQGHSAGGHVYAKRQVDGSKYWQQAYNVPEHGVDFTFISTGNPTQLGRQISSSYMLNLPLLRKQIVGDNIQIPSTGFAHWLGLGLGMGYATKRWDLETNHQAAVLGSKLNVAISIQYSTRLWAFHSGELRAGLRISHFSNGAFQLPNLGTNNAGVFLSYASRSKSPSAVRILAAPSHERYLFSVGLVGGLKEIQPPTGRKYTALVLSTLAERRVSYKSAFGLGLDLLYDSSIRPQVQPRTDVVVTPMQVMQLGAVFSYSLFFDRFALKIQQGYYLADAWRLSGSLYHRVGLRYTIGRHMYAQLTLKTHFAKADYGEVGIGYCFRK